MDSSESVGKLIIVSGLPGSGKTTLAKRLEAELHAIRMSPDDWMDALSINLYDEDSRVKIEALQWKLGQELLKHGLVVVIEWGTWGKSERDALRAGARKLGAAVELRYVSAPPDILFDRIQRRGRLCSNGFTRFKFRPMRKWHCLIHQAKSKISPRRRCPNFVSKSSAR